MKSSIVLLLFSAVLLCPVLGMAAGDSAAAHNQSGVALVQAGKINEAIAEFEKAVALDGTYFPARLNLAYAYEKGDRSQQALDAYREAIGIQPNSFFAHNNLGVLYDGSGLYDSAIGEFEAALQIDPGNAAARRNLETARQNKAQVEKRKNELSQAEKEAESRPNDPRAAYNLARLYAYYGNKDSALQWLDAATKRGYKDFAYLRNDPAFGNFRNDREFELLLSGK